MGFPFLSAYKKGEYLKALLIGFPAGSEDLSKSYIATQPVYRIGDRVWLTGCA